MMQKSTEDPVRHDWNECTRSGFNHDTDVSEYRYHYAGGLLVQKSCALGMSRHLIIATARKGTTKAILDVFQCGLDSYIVLYSQPDPE
jgi:hypothetical protein